MCTITIKNIASFVETYEAVGNTGLQFFARVYQADNIPRGLDHFTDGFAALGEGVAMAECQAKCHQEVIDFATKYESYRPLATLNPHCLMHRV